MSSSQIFLIWSWKLAIASGGRSRWLSEDAVIGLPMVVVGLRDEVDGSEGLEVVKEDLRGDVDGLEGLLVVEEDLRGEVDG